MIAAILNRQRPMLSRTHQIDGRAIDNYLHRCSAKCKFRLAGVLNLALGGTGIVWLGCLVWACGAVHKAATEEGSDGGESGLNVFANDVQKVEVVGNQTDLPGSPLDQLERLKRLLDEKVINNEEFERLKAKLLMSS